MHPVVKQDDIVLQVCDAHTDLIKFPCSRSATCTTCFLQDEIYAVNLFQRLKDASRCVAELLTNHTTELYNFQQVCFVSVLNNSLFELFKQST